MSVNLFTYTEEFDNAAWTKFSCTITPNAATDPNGGLTADALVEVAALDIHAVAGIVVLGVADYTISCHAAPASRNWLRINLGGTGAVWFNVSTGVVGSMFPAACFSSASMVPAANGFYRCIATATSSGGGSSHDIGSSDADGSNTHTGNGSTALYLWGAQLEQASSASAYQRVPHLDQPGLPDSRPYTSLRYGGGVPPSIPAGLKSERGRPGPALRALQRFAESRIPFGAQNLVASAVTGNPASYYAQMRRQA